MRVTNWWQRWYHDRYDIDAEIESNKAKFLPGMEAPDYEIMARAGQRRAETVLKAQKRQHDGAWWIA